MSNDNHLYVICPHCDGVSAIHPSEINCGIFRHGVFKVNGQQMNPHESKENCDRFAEQGLILGCGKPFRLVNGSAEICDYI